MKYKILILFSLIVAFFNACDSGDIYDPIINPGEGINVSASIVLSGIEAYPEEYDLMLAAFEPERETPILLKKIAKPANNNDTVKVELTDISPTVNSVKVCIIKERTIVIYSFFEENISGQENIEIEHGVNLLSYDRIQTEVFSKFCIACHGTGQGAAKLLLSQGKSYNQLVNHPSSRRPDLMRVKPGSVDESYLMTVLSNPTEITNPTHTLLLTSNDDYTLLREWIKQLK